MVKLNKIYTRTGDDGTTGLVDKLLYDESTGKLIVPMSAYFGS